MLDIKRVIASSPRKPVPRTLRPLSTPWSECAASDKADCSLHPHPQFERASFQSLNGWWDFCIIPAADAARAWRSAPIPFEWDGRIAVPFSPEATLSKVGRQLMPDELLWYRRSFDCPCELQEEAAGLRCILHFEAVDYACAVYCNGKPAGTNVGGYLPFSFDITDALSPGENEITLCVYDPSDRGVQLRGKQKLQRGGIWYTAQSGIWQTVWLETVPKRRIDSLKIDVQPDTGRLTLGITVLDFAVSGNMANEPNLTLTAKLLDAGETICTASVESAPRTDGGFAAGSDQGRIGVTDAQGSAALQPPPPAKPGEDGLSHTLYILELEISKPHLWSPEDPYLYQLELTYGDDKVASYCAFRSVSIERDGQGTCRLHINHRPCFLRGVLDQGYWPDGLMTAPSDEALAFDIQAMKDLGFNMLRKHIKVESDRWYYHCDRLGMLVWQDMVCGGSPYQAWHTSHKPTLFRWSWGHCKDSSRHYSHLAAESSDFRDEWTWTCAETVGYLYNHPSVITWVLFNEGWGQFDAAEATNLVRRLDPTRPIDAVSGWYDQACGDFLSVHNYFRPLEVYDDPVHPKRAFVISEFGGLSYHLPEHSSLALSYGYESYSDASSFRTAVFDAIDRADSLEAEGLAGFVYTQLSDVEEETNGLLSYDRRVNKLDAKDGV